MSFPVDRSSSHKAICFYWLLKEKDLEAKFIIQMEKSKTTITNLKIPEGGTGDSGRERTKTFTYDFSFYSADTESPDYVSQEMVFKTLGTDVVKSAFEGYNACVFAYGQTGSGKSYTMMGDSGDSGLIPRICEGLFSQINETTRWDEASFRTEVSYLEIYNERVRDLLRRKSSKTFNLRVREHPKEGPYVEDLSKHLVQNYGDVEELMDAGNINRTTAATGMNDVSSRSHAIFTIKFTQAKFDSEMPSETVSKIHLVDLAGSERADATGATGVRLKEGGNINKSLVTLGNVISALADLSQDAANPLGKKKQVFVPYRDSVLTWLLKDSLGGNSKTIMIATISPADVNYGETLSTLRYANRAKNIINKPTINEDANVKLIRELRAEIARLKTLLAQGNQIALLDSPTALSMEEKLQQNEARVQELTKEWTTKWNETQNILKEQTLALRKEGIGVVLDSELPHLIGIYDDLLSTGMILYHLKEGQTYVGREDASTEQDIVLHGLDLESEHCIFENVGGTVTLIPLSGSQCSVNGVQIMEATHLNQGAMILLGRTNMFRFNHPKEAAKLREKRKSGLLSSLSLSMSDLSKSRENLSAVMLYNPGLEFERQQREELEKLESKRKLIEEMEEKQKSDKAALERMQQEVETQRQETEMAQRQIRKQEESLKRRSSHLESTLKDLLAEKERFEEARQREQQETELQKKKQEEEHFLRVQEELQRLQELNSHEKAEKVQIFQELERLKREKAEQYTKLEQERQREQEQDQVLREPQLEAQPRARQQLSQHGEARRAAEERRQLEGIRAALLRAREARAAAGGDGPELERAQLRFSEFKRTQLATLANMEKELLQQKDLLKRELEEDREFLRERLASGSQEELRGSEKEEEGGTDILWAAVAVERMQPAEGILQCKKRQLRDLLQQHLPRLSEEKQRVREILDRGPLGLDYTLYLVEKEMEEKEEQLAQYQASASPLQKLQATFECTANVARQEEKARRKEEEILESREQQQRQALERAVARLGRRHSALQRRCARAAGGEQEALQKDRERLEHEIRQLKLKICEVDGVHKGHRGTLEGKPAASSFPSSAEKSHPVPLMDARISAYIEEEVQRRLQGLHRVVGDGSSDPADTMKDNEKLHNGTIQRKLKYEKSCPAPLLPRDVTDAPGQEESGEVDQTHHGSLPMTWSVPSPSARCSAPGCGANQRRSRPLEHEPSHSSSCNRGNSRPESLDLTETSFSESSTSGAGHFHGESENLSEPTRPQGGPSLGLASSWTWLQHTSQEVSVDSRGEQTWWSQLLCFLLSERVPQASVPPVALASKFRWEEAAAGAVSSPESLMTVKPEGSRGLGFVYQWVSDLYKDTRSHLLWAGAEAVGQARLVGSLCDPSRLASQAVTFLTRLPILNLSPLHRLLETGGAAAEALFLPREARLGSRDEAEPVGRAGSLAPYRALGWPTGPTATEFPGSSPGSVSCLELEGARRGFVFKQTLVRFPDQMLKLQECPLTDFLELVAGSLPELWGNTDVPRGMYWLAVANCAEPAPRPVCLLLFGSALYALVLDPLGSMGMFHALPLSGLQEIQVGFGGQSIRLLGSAESLLLTVFTYNKNLCRQICRDLLCVLASASEAAACAEHPLFREDLVQLSLDWKAEIPDLVLANRVRLSSRFQNTLVDLIYFLHSNLDAGAPSLAEAQLWLYTTVRVEGDPGQGPCQSLVLLNTHVALVREDRVFYPRSPALSSPPPGTRFDVVRCRALSEFRCLVIPETKTSPTLELIFLQNLRHQADLGSGASRRPQEGQKIQPCTSTLDLQGGEDVVPEVWKLTFNSQDEALWLTSHLTRL
ncbi:kinesin-like protein KIF16B isoform X3 [Moschus berezovskii]|uniref:kinesin-like protein KIF16B isoform X3 n=1 Tax=Moschus berezovskii TaxID=68408 RepID=UPI002444A0AD|nr:kinesin-like protein KIF16B isoform X3 [Moschus berezovskii]